MVDFFNDSPPWMSVIVLILIFSDIGLTFYLFKLDLIGKFKIWWWKRNEKKAPRPLPSKETTIKINDESYPNISEQLVTKIENLENLLGTNESMDTKHSQGVIKDSV